jgi:hypothetical protein
VFGLDRSLLLMPMIDGYQRPPIKFLSHVKIAVEPSRRDASSASQ